MENELIKKLRLDSFIEITQIDKKSFLTLTAPCRFTLKEDIVTLLKEKYLPNEEIGGILWGKPIVIDNEKVYMVEKISFIRNAIEDSQRKDHRDRSNAYLPDRSQFIEEFEKASSNGYIPIKFHSHPVKEKDFLLSLNKSLLNTETSKQDRIESDMPSLIGGQEFLLPRILIVGNDFSSADLFIGIYGGFIAPKEFESSKEKIKEENLDKLAKSISNVELSDNQKVGLAVGALLLLYVIGKYPKYSLPVIVALGIAASIFSTNTHHIERPNYFNRLLFGDADIFIPKIDGQD